MGTLTISAAGFSNLGAAPTGWPSVMTWPTGDSPNGSKSYTVSDSDWASLLSWIASTETNFNGKVTSNSTPTATGLLLTWVQNWINFTISAVQNYSKVVTTPSPISIQ